MIELQTITIIISVVILLLAIVTPLINPFFRLPKALEEGRSTDENTVRKPISIVIIAHDNAPELQKKLPVFLTQDYPADYEVIVVAEEKGSETEDVIKQISNEHKHLYATYLPDSSRYLSRKKLAITLGIKAAHHPWVIITDAWCTPMNENWLTAMANYCTDDKSLVLGYTQYGYEASANYHYEHIRTGIYNYKKAETGAAFGINSPLVAIRKELFMSRDGYRANLKFTRGEYDFLVNQYADGQNTSLALQPDAWLAEDTPYPKRWANKHLFAISSHHNMEGNAKMTVLYQIDMLMMHINNIACICGIIYGAMRHDWIVLAVASFALLLSFILRALVASKAVRLFDLQFSSYAIPLLDYTLSLRNIGWRLRYFLADKNDFITHKL